MAVAVAGIALAACGGGASDDAVAACRGVHVAITDYDRSLTAPTKALAATDVAAAQHQIAEVMSDGAMADSGDGSYNALMTLLQQAQEVPFANVVPALRASCAFITSPTNYL